MSGFFEAFLVKLFFALGDRLVSEGSEYLKQWKDIKEAVNRAQEFKKVINNPKSTLKDRLDAEDRLGS